MQLHGMTCMPFDTLTSLLGLKAKGSGFGLVEADRHGQ